MGCWSLMARTLTEAFPDAKTLLALPPEELGGVILEVAHAEAGVGQRVMFSMPGILGPINNRHDPAWSQGQRHQVTQAVAEAMAWLEQSGLIIPDPTQGHGTSYRTVSRRGTEHYKALASGTRHTGTDILPADLVHTRILEKSRAAFVRGEFDHAVFAAFKAVEVAVRDACGYPDSEFGVPLMRKAFHPETGPLTDKAVVTSEREAMSALFAGGIGAAKNPASHREFEVGKVEAARLILFASYLMSIVEGRAGGR